MIYEIKFQITRKERKEEENNICNFFKFYYIYKYLKLWIKILFIIECMEYCS